MTTLEEIRTVDATQPDDDGVVDFIYIDHPDEGILRRTNYRGGDVTIVAGGTFSFSDFRVSLPPLGDDLVGGLVLEMPWQDGLAEALRSVASGDILVAWHQLTAQNIGALDTFPTTWGHEGVVDTVDISRELVRVRCVALVPLDAPAGMRYDADAFPSLHAWEDIGQTAGEPALIPADT